MNGAESQLDNTIDYWTGRAVMRWYRGYKGGDITIFGNGEKRFITLLVSNVSTWK